MTDHALTVLIVGATGSIGQHVVEQAVRAGHHTRALVRSNSKARGLASGAQAVIGDLTDASTLAEAVDGIDAVVFTHGSSNEPEAVNYWAIVSREPSPGGPVPRSIPA